MNWLLRPYAVNRTWIVGVWCIGVLAGIAVVRAGLLLQPVVVVIIGLVLLPVLFTRSRLMLGLAIVSGFLLGNWQGARTDAALNGLYSYVGQKVEVSGTVSDDPVFGKRKELEFMLGNVVIDGTPRPGHIKISMNTQTDVRRGDTVRAYGKVSSGFGNYQARIGFAELRGYEKSHQPILQARDAFADGVRQAIPDPQASLGLGFLLGQRSALPEQLDEDMRRVGLTHIVVASGYNLTILVRAARRLLAPISKFQAMAGSLGLVAAFVVVTGFSPSMTRAGLVTVLSLWAWYYGRRVHPLVLLLFAAAITAFINPIFLWSDLGWYLSFLAFAGVLLLAPLLTQRFWGGRQLPLLGQVSLETVCAQIMTVPLILWAFGQFSVLALVANLLVVPLIPLVMIATFIAGVVGIILPVAAALVGLPATLIMSYMTGVTTWLASIQWALTETSIAGWAMMGLYGIIAVLGLVIWRRLKFNFLHSSITD